MGEFHLCCRELGHVAERDGDGSDSTASAASTELVRPFSNRSRRRRILGNCRLLNPGIRSSNRVFLQLSRIEGRQAFGFDPMCIAVFLWRCHPLYRFFLLHNRDEYHGRPTEALSWWNGEGGQLLGGRDTLAGGTWLACSRNGKMAFITNVREIQNIPQAKTRGDLPIRFLQSTKSPLEFAEEVVKEVHLYNGFNLILANFLSESMVYLTNRPYKDSSYISQVSPGIHVLSNASLDSPWPKAQRLRNGFVELLNIHGDGELPAREMADKLMMNDTKDEEKSLLTGIYTPQFEYQLSSVFVDTDSPLGRYGTRSISALTVKSDWEMSFYERHLEDKAWKDKTVTFIIEADDRS